jgi:outer membrane protein TolC
MAGRTRRRLFLIVAAALAAAAAQLAAAGHPAAASARAVRDLQLQNVKLIADTLRQARGQYAAGEITATDMAQVEAQPALARSSLAAAQAQYAAARANYLAVIGVEPGPAAGTFRRQQPRTAGNAGPLQEH